MKVLTYSQYCKNKEARSQIGFMNGLYIYKGKFYTKQEIDAMFPIDLPLINAMDKRMHDTNPDKSKNYLKNIKSY